MKRSLPLYLLLLVLSLCCACTDHHAMVQRLAYVSACNRADTVFTSRWLPTVDSLVSLLLEEYEVDEATARGDAETLVQKWQEAGIID